MAPFVSPMDLYSTLKRPHEDEEPYSAAKRQCWATPRVTELPRAALKRQHDDDQWGPSPKRVHVSSFLTLVPSPPPAPSSPPATPVTETASTQVETVDARLMQLVPYVPRLTPAPVAVPPVSAPVDLPPVSGLLAQPWLHWPLPLAGPSGEEEETEHRAENNSAHIDMDVDWSVD